MRTGQDISEEEINEQKDFLDRIDQSTLANYEDLEKRKLEDLRLEKKEGDPEELQRQLEYASKRQALDEIVANKQLKIDPVLIEGTTNEAYSRIIEEALEEKREEEIDAQKVRAEQERIEQEAINSRKQLAALEKSKETEESIAEKKK